MKKMFLALLSLVVVSMFLVSCGPKEGETALVGEAFKAGDAKKIIPIKTCTLDNVCKELSELKESLDNTYTAMAGRSENNCVKICAMVNGGKCLAGYGYDIDTFTMKGAFACNVSGRNTGLGENTIMDCLCRK